METFTYLFKSAVILAIFYTVYTVFLRKDTLFTAKRHYFIGGIIAAIVLPFVTFTRIVEKELVAVESSMIYEASTTAMEPLVQDPVAGINAWQIAFIIYLLGILVLSVRFTIQLFKLLRLIRSYPAQKNGAHTFVKADEYIAPFSFFNYIVYNPSLHSHEELAMILAHEKVHATQWHSIDLLFAQCISILQWGNPFSWWYKKSMEQNLEFIADSETVSQIASKKSYQLTLVRASSPLYAPVLTTQFYQSFIKKRIIMLNKQHSKKRNLLKAFIILPFLALFLWSFNVTEVINYTEVSSTSEGDPPTEIANPISENTTSPVTKATPETKTFSQTEGKELGEHLGINSNTQMITENPNLVTSKETEVSTNAERSFLQEFRFNINKNTTDSQLKKIKEELKRDHDIDLSYTVVRNSSGEITSINMSYNGGSNNGSYSISDDGPIEEFQFYMNEEGRNGFYSEAMEERRRERMERRREQMEERAEEREARMEQRMAEREERLAHLEEEREERVFEMKERHEEMEERHEEMQERHEEMQERHEEMEERAHKKMKEHHKKVAKMNKKVHRIISHGQNRHRISSNHDEHIIITKNTSDAALNQIKSDLAAKGISFSYKRLKRNSNGEIISIKIDIDNNKGSKTQASHKGGSDEPINDIVIEL